MLKMSDGRSSDARRSVGQKKTKKHFNIQIARGKKNNQSNKQTEVATQLQNMILTNYVWKKKGGKGVTSY